MRDPTWPVWTLQLQTGPDGSDHIEFSTGFTPCTADECVKSVFKMAQNGL